MDFHQKQVVWAKVKGYPWWPAYINKLPEGTEGNFKVIFFAEDTYALLQPKCVQKFAENYSQHSKTKAKKFLKALQLANSSANRISFPVCIKNLNQSMKKGQKKQTQQCFQQEQESIESEEKSSQKPQESQSMIHNQEIDLNIEKDAEQVDRRKVEKIQNELSQIIGGLQLKTIGTKDWRYSKYFQTFLEQYDPNSEQLLHSNLTRKIRYIIECMKNYKIDSRQIQKLQQLSSHLKKKVMDYLTDTAYYDQHLRVIDKSRHNKAEVENTINKLMRRRFNGQIKREYINILAMQIGIEVGRNLKFKARELTSDMKEGLHDGSLRIINSKAATQRMADQLIAAYRE